MKTPKKVTPEQIKKARRAGIKAKKPRKGALRTKAAAERYIERYNAWVDRIKQGAHYFDIKEKEAKDLKKAKAMIAGL